MSRPTIPPSPAAVQRHASPSVERRPVPNRSPPVDALWNADVGEHELARALVEKPGLRQRQRHRPSRPRYLARRLSRGGIEAGRHVEGKNGRAPVRPPDQLAPPPPPRPGEPVAAPP